MGRKNLRRIADGTRPLSIARSLSQTACHDYCIRVDAVGLSYTTHSRLRIAENVPVLRFNHAAVEVVLPGVREVARAGRGKIDELFADAHFGGSSNERRRSICFGQFSWCF